MAGQWEPVSLAAAFSVFGRSGAVAAQAGDYTFAQIAGTVSIGQLPSLAGDVSGTVTGATVVKIQSRPVASATPTAGQVLAWDGSQWMPTTTSGAVTSVFGRTGVVTAQGGDYSFPQIGGTVATAQLPSAGGDLSGSLALATVTGLQGRAVASNSPSTGHVLTWNGAQWAPSAPTGQVTSTFGRTGAVTAQSGDYTFAQIGGAVGSEQLPAAGGDLSGGLASASVVRLQGRTLSAVQPSTGHVLTWDGAQWGPAVPGGVTSTFGRTGAVTSQSGDYSFAQISGAVSAGTIAGGGRRPEWVAPGADRSEDSESGNLDSIAFRGTSAGMGRHVSGRRNR